MKEREKEFQDESFYEDDDELEDENDFSIEEPH
jgi:hypothetical protein